MEYIRTYLGYHITNFRHRRGFRTEAFRGNLNTASGDFICYFEQDGLGEPTEIHWSNAASPQDRFNLILAGIRVHNAEMSRQGGELYRPDEVRDSEELSEHMTRVAVEAIAHDLVCDRHWRRIAHKQIIALTNKGNVYTSLGVYDPSRRDEIVEHIEASMEPGEFLTEIVNERYLAQ